MSSRLRLAWALALATAAPFAGCSSSSAPPPPAPAAGDDAGADAGALPCTSPDFTGSPLGVRCDGLVDAQGRTVLLHGINARVDGVFDVAHDDGRPPNEVDPAFTADDAAQIRALGYNALRLPIHWSAIEPTEHGGFDEAYLDRVAGVVALCKAADVLVLLDFHQDGFSKEIGEDGAPMWAISPAPTALTGGDAGVDLGTEQGAAFDTFFGTSSEGQYLRDRFTAMAVHVATRFKDDPGVFGIELFNEPLASDTAIHPLYTEVIPPMRAAMPSKLILWEPSVLRNQLDQATQGDGTSLGAGTVYAPHVYTNAFAGGDGFTKDSLSPSNVNARAEADSWGSPLVITEWGFSPADARYADYVRFQQELQEDARASAFYWLWKEESSGRWGLFDFAADGTWTLRPAVAQALARPRLEAVAGRLTSVAYDMDAKRFEARFVGSAAITAPNVVSIGSAVQPPAAQWKATCDGASAAGTSSAGTGLLQIACNGDGPHVVVVTP